MAPIDKINIEFVRLMCYNFNGVLYVLLLWLGDNRISKLSLRNFSKEMIGDFEVFVGQDTSKTEFQFIGENTIMTVNTDATYTVGKEFIENIKEL